MQETDRERLVRPKEFAATRHFVKTLRHKKDMQPFLVRRQQRNTDIFGRTTSIMRVCDYCSEFPEYEPVVGFTLWVFGADHWRPDGTLEPVHRQSGYVAKPHAIAHKKGATVDEMNSYVDVADTNPPTDYKGQEMIFIPTSRALPGWSPWHIAKLEHWGFFIQASSHCARRAVEYAREKCVNGLWTLPHERISLHMCPDMWHLMAFLLAAGLDETQLDAMLKKLLARGARVIQGNTTQGFFMTTLDIFREEMNFLLCAQEAIGVSTPRQVYRAWQSRVFDDGVGGAARFVREMKPTHKSGAEVFNEINKF